MLYYGFNTFPTSELIKQVMHNPICPMPKGRVSISYSAYKLIC